jgi:predicted metal-dependent peptidase
VALSDGARAGVTRLAHRVAQLKSSSLGTMPVPARRDAWALRGADVKALIAAVAVETSGAARSAAVHLYAGLG